MNVTPVADLSDPSILMEARGAFAETKLGKALGADKVPIENL